jgi:Zn-finger nucleic acid-binding protein
MAQKLSAMEARTLNCPMCGASAATDATKCQHCGARLATISCPSCFGMIFSGAKFCCHCGAAATRVEVTADVPMPCPRCRVDTHAVVIGTSPLRECPKCEGIWADKDTLHQICSDHERQAAVLGTPAVMPTDLIGNIEKNIRYVPCPVCKALMNRINFSRCSHVVVDVCAKHGTWFDKDELRRVVEFIRVGGLDKARDLEMRELERRRRELAATRVAGGMGDFASVPSPRYRDAGVGIRVVADVLDAFLR